MAWRLSLGQYFDAPSPVHALDARAKLCCSLAVMVSVFFVRSPLELALGYAFILAAVSLSHIPVRKVVDAVKPAAFVLLVLSLFNLFTTTGGTLLWQAGPLRITDSGLHAALLFSLRLLIGVVAGILLLLTTTPARLTDAFDALLAPLARLGLPAHELAMVFSLMLRFIPTLADEARAVADAQTARGGALGEGSPLKRVRAVVPVLVSLLASSLHHANDLARALDARCYEGGSARSHWHPLHMEHRDWLAVAITAGYAALLCLL